MTMVASSDRDANAERANLATVLAWFDAAWCRGDVGAYDEFADPALVLHLTGYAKPFRGREEVKTWARAHRAGSPDVRFDVDEAIVDGERVVLRWTSHTTVSGKYVGVPAARLEATTEALQLFHVVDGRIREAWLLFDSLGVLQQLGVLPAGPPPRALLMAVGLVRRVRTRLTTWNRTLRPTVNA